MSFKNKIVTDSQGCCCFLNKAPNQFGVSYILVYTSNYKHNEKYVNWKTNK